MSVYDIVTQKIIQKLEQGVAIWHKPWKSSMHPKNFASKKPYHGINTWLLLMSDYDSPYWLTFRQCKQLKGHVKAGAKGSQVVYWCMVESEQEEKDKKVPMLRYYTVFNSEDCVGLPEVEAEKKKIDFAPIEKCEQIIRGYKDKPEIIYRGDRAFYTPAIDKIQMPKPSNFVSEEDFYSTLWHEGIHSTGHSSRLNRSTLAELAPFGTPTYSKEEMVAELGASILCAYTDIDNKTIDNSAAYISNWLTKLKNDKTLIITAASKAEKAVRYILNCQE